MEERNPSPAMVRTGGFENYLSVFLVSSSDFVCALTFLPQASLGRAAVAGGESDAAGYEMAGQWGWQQNTKRQRQWVAAGVKAVGGSRHWSGNDSGRQQCWEAVRDELAPTVGCGRRRSDSSGLQASRQWAAPEKTNGNGERRLQDKTAAVGSGKRKSGNINGRWQARK